MTPKITVKMSNDDFEELVFLLGEAIHDKEGCAPDNDRTWNIISKHLLILLEALRRAKK